MIKIKHEVRGYGDLDYFEKSGVRRHGNIETKMSGRIRESDYYITPKGVGGVDMKPWTEVENVKY